MSELRQNGTRFRVVELKGWVINPGSYTGNRPQGLSVSVLDSACCWKEVGRFATGRGGLNRAFVRAKALNLAAELNEAFA